MIWLVLGIALWWGAHLFKRVAPGPRAALQERMGNASKGFFAVLLVLSVVLMVIGFRRTELGQLWLPPEWTVHVNNVLMLLAVFLFGVSGSKSRLRSRLRHPQLSGFILWAVAHLLVNGDWASVILFGALLVWAVVEIVVLNARAPRPEPYAGGSVAGDIRLVVISLVVFAVIVLIHGWLGRWPLPT